MLVVTDELNSGSVLIRTEARLPQGFDAGGQMLVPGWEALPGIGAAEIERELARIGWHLFFVVDPSPQENGLAFDRNGAILRALRRLVRRAERRQLNALEIRNIAVRPFGPLNWARVEVNFRHIGETPVLFKKRKKETELGRHSIFARTA
jgi:GNAT superfamily N-acetyltransferase